MKKILCMMLAFVLCISIFTYATAEEAKKAAISATVSFGPFSLELPDGWDAKSFDLKVKAAEKKDSTDGSNMLEDGTSWSLELGASDGGAIITIEICDVQEYMRNQVDNAADSLIGRLVLKNFLSRNMVEYLFDEEMRASVLIEQAKQFGKSREDIVEYQFGEYDFSGFSYTGQDVLKHVGEGTRISPDAVAYMYAGAVEGYVVLAGFVDYTKDHFGVLQELLGALKISDADTSEPIAAYGPVSFDANKEWVETFRLTGENHLQAELTSIYDTDVSFLLTIYDVWPNILEEISASGRELDENSRGDFDSLEMATEYLLLLTQTSNIDADDIENCQLGEYDFCRTIMPECKALDGSKACNVPIYSAFIDSYWIYFYLFPSDDSDLFGAFIDTLDSISINAANAVL